MASQRQSGHGGYAVTESPTKIMIRRWFQFMHLPEGAMRNISILFVQLARELEDTVHDSAEKEAGMRKLLEAKDCFVRAVMEDD